tara:strand:+ start:664 stop:978 length:315 start_codon:yes stop_codon:yes gene_type:complete
MFLTATWGQTMNESTKNAILACITKQGKFKGTFKRTLPRPGVERAAWLGVMLVFNPYKVGIGAVMMLTDDQRVVMDDATLWAENNQHLRFADRDRGTLETLGAW